MQTRIVVLAVLLVVSAYNRTLAQTETAEAANPAASIDQLAWIAGHWQGEAMGGKFEESWNPPMAGAMMGMFKFVKDDQIEFYELMTIVPDGESFVLRLKHFDAGLKGWEEKDKSVEFALKEVSDGVAKFDGLTFRRVSADRLDIDVAIKSDDKQPPQVLKFAGRRVGGAITDQEK